MPRLPLSRCCLAAARNTVIAGLVAACYLFFVPAVPASAAEPSPLVFVLKDGAVVRAVLVKKLATGYLVRMGDRQVVLFYEEIREVANGDDSVEAPAAAQQGIVDTPGDSERPGQGWITAGWIAAGTGATVAGIALAMYQTDVDCYEYKPAGSGMFYRPATYCSHNYGYLGAAAIAGVVAAAGLTVALIGRSRRASAEERARALPRGHAMLPGPSWAGASEDVLGAIPRRSGLGAQSESRLTLELAPVVPAGIQGFGFSLLGSF